MPQYIHHLVCLISKVNIFNISHNIISQHISIYLNIVNIYIHTYIYIHINVLIYNRHEHVQCKYIDAEKLENIGESS